MSMSGVVAALQRRAKELDETLYQSEGSTAEGPAAVSAAPGFGRFWGPWERDVPVVQVV